MDFVNTMLKPEDTVISLNYDLLIDDALTHKYKQVNYGSPFRELIASTELRKDKNWETFRSC